MSPRGLANATSHMNHNPLGIETSADCTAQESEHGTINGILPANASLLNTLDNDLVGNAVKMELKPYYDEPAKENNKISMRN
jgi:hypothetical protein